ncbi:hypothetical protein B0F90DRAFT_1815394 [Multifurca ochricompacta]|uniref:Uncharacterized protein n=1 Tax=Multifurca ochricompacta TaxID=376703 RepID=A0AAD4M7Y4_9AGAM|nr:hypothetical protein B0F90DRAFT_1815394 [Multifurca ochricompacta]
MSNSSRNSSHPPEDWDLLESSVDPSAINSVTPVRIVFPSHDSAHDSPMPNSPPHGGRNGKRTLSELLKLHAEKGTDVHFTTEEATRLEEVLGQWINASSSPYEGEDDFFTRPHDDSIVLTHRSSTFKSIIGLTPRSQNEGLVFKS